jgi:hypothetical protein
MHQNAQAGVNLLSQFNRGSLTYLQGIESATKNVKKASPVLRYLLTESLQTKEGHYNDAYSILEQQFEVINQTISMEQTNNAKFMVERLRIFLSKEVNAVDKRWENKFNEFADKLSIEHVDLSDKVKSNEFPYEVKKIKLPDFANESVDKIVEWFEKLVHTDKIDVEKDFVNLLNSKVKDLSEREIDKLVLFVTKTPLLHSEGSLLLKNVAERYKELGSNKYTNTVVKAFEIGYSWNYNWNDRIDWLVEIYGYNREKSMNIILKSFAWNTIEKYGPTGAIERLGKFLSETGQVDLLRQSYNAVHAFYKNLFREI